MNLRLTEKDWIIFTPTDSHILRGPLARQEVDRRVADIYRDGYEGFSIIICENIRVAVIGSPLTIEEYELLQRGV
jgi:hypothetical protein